jgi:hypothetical protein
MVSQGATPPTEHERMNLFCCTPGSRVLLIWPMPRNDPPASRWAAIIATRMPRAATQRVRTGRRLRQTGAVAVRPGVYALPDSAGGRKALATAARELSRRHGLALPCLLTWLDPGDEVKLWTRYEQERSRRRLGVLNHIHNLERTLAPASRLGARARQTAHARLARLRKHLERASFGGSMTPASGPAGEPPRSPIPTSGAVSCRGRTWVTRRGVLVDRIASAWLIQGFIDHEAQFRFVTPDEPPAQGELRFDMADADFGHADGRCTFETLVERFRADDPALRQLAEIIHDLDVKDGKYRRAEAPGVALIIAGLAASEPDDGARIRRGRGLFDCLYRALRPGPTPRLPKGVLP